MNIFARFFLWCSGTDITTLNLVKQRDRKSFGYQVAYGTFVLVPTVMAFVGMMHAASNFSNDELVWVIAGLTFAGMIFAFDRFIVQSYQKGNKGLFRMRIAVSIPLGFIISLLGIFLAFNKEIGKRVEDDVRDKLENVVKKYEQKKDSVRYHDIRLTSDIECLRLLRTYEQTGKDTILPCGVSSGKLGQAARFKELGEQISAKETERENERKRITPEIDENNRLRDIDIETINQTRGQDPLTELLALWEVVKDKPIALLLVFGLWFLLMSLDLFPVIAKGLTQATLYDYVYRSEDTAKMEMSNFLKETQNDINNYDPPKIGNKEGNKSNSPILYSFIIGISISTCMSYVWGYIEENSSIAQGLATISTLIVNAIALYEQRKK